MTIGSHILLGLDLWGVRNSKIRFGVIYHCSIRHMYRIRRMGTMCAFIGNDKERVWWTPKHMWQPYFHVSHILESHFDEGHFSLFGAALEKVGCPRWAACVFAP